VLLHHRFDALAGAFADAAFVVEHAGYRRFPTPLKRAISLMVSRFCMRNSRQGEVSLMLLNQTAMSKVWFTFGLVARVYHRHYCYE
jgi:hypothetical protein